ncbi:ABC transporter permease, partial [Mesorhizobium sp. M7A.F.Ca.US.005.03.1.1]
MRPEMTAASLDTAARTSAERGALARARLLRGLLPALSLALVLLAIAWLNPRAISYF